MYEVLIILGALFKTTVDNALNTDVINAHETNHFNIQCFPQLTLNFSLSIAFLIHRMLFDTVVPETNTSGYRIKYPPSASIIQTPALHSPSR